MADTSQPQTGASSGALCAGDPCGCGLCPDDTAPFYGEQNRHMLGDVMHHALAGSWAWWCVCGATAGGFLSRESAVKDQAEHEREASRG